MSYFTDKEHRILLRALGRERVVCEEVDRNYLHDPCIESLTAVCDSIEKKIYNLQHAPQSGTRKKWNDVVRALEYLRDTKLCSASCEDRNCYVSIWAYDMAIALIKETKLDG